MAVTPNIGLTEPIQGTTPWDAIVNGNMTIIDNCLGGSQVIPAIAPTNIKPNNVTTILAGVPALVAKADLTAQAANVGTTTLYAVPASGAGMYRINAYVVVTQQASVSATMPSVIVGWTDADTNAVTAATFTPVSGAANPVVGVNSSNSTPTPAAAGADVIQVKASTNINYSTTSYASSGATPMQYAVHIKLEYLGL